MDKTYLIELVRNMPPLWYQRDKIYHNRDLKPKLWEEIGHRGVGDISVFHVSVPLFLYSRLWSASTSPKHLLYQTFLRDYH